MTLVTNARNAAMNALAPDAMSLHSAYPGDTGANELTGGGYTRQSATWAASSGGVMTLSGTVTFTVGAGHDVKWIGVWAGSTFLGYSPNNGSPQEFAVTAASDLVTLASHLYSDTDTITFYGGTLPSPLVAGTIYYVRDATTDTFKVAATSGGAAIDLTTVGATDALVSAITTNTYAGADTHQITAFPIGMVT